MCEVGPHPTYWETQAISSSVLNTIWLVLLLWTTSPLTRQQIFKLCGSEKCKSTTLGFLFSLNPLPLLKANAEGGFVTSQMKGLSAGLLGLPPSRVSAWVSLGGPVPDPRLGEKKWLFLP